MASGRVPKTTRTLFLNLLPSELFGEFEALRGFAHIPGSRSPGLVLQMLSRGRDQETANCPYCR